MFANVGWGEMLVLVIAGLVILGPERLPGAIRWAVGRAATGRRLRQRRHQPTARRPRPGVSRICARR